MLQRKELQLKEGAAVVTPGGKQLGKVEAFVVDPATQEVTHIVVKKGGLLAEDKVLPMRMVQSASEQRVLLTDDRPDFDKLPPFEVAHYVEAGPNAGEQPPFGATGTQLTYYYWNPPVGSPGFPAYGMDPYAWPPSVTERNIPKSTVPLKEGTQVFTSDGEEVGHIERLFLLPDSDKVSHVLISHGLLPVRRLLPIGWVRSIAEDKLVLNVPIGIVKGVRPYGSR